jgi:hypothetical protein
MTSKHSSTGFRMSSVLAVSLTGVRRLESSKQEHFDLSGAHASVFLGLFRQFLYGVLGSSLSSGAARRRLQICRKALEDGIGDAPLEAP